jgi:sarcosine oxidase subunit alpha
MPETLTISIDGRRVSVREGASVAAALLGAGLTAFCRSPRGSPRAPLCGMGICFECRVTIDGRSNIRSCQLICQDGMDIRTDVRTDVRTG